MAHSQPKKRTLIRYNTEILYFPDASVSQLSEAVTTLLSVSGAHGDSSGLGKHYPKVICPGGGWGGGGLSLHAQQQEEADALLFLDHLVSDLSSRGTCAPPHGVVQVSAAQPRKRHSISTIDTKFLLTVISLVPPFSSQIVYIISPLHFVKYFYCILNIP